MSLAEEPLDATVHLAFAFDIGYEIDLDRARALVPTESGLISRRRRTPGVDPVPPGSAPVDPRRSGDGAAGELRGHPPAPGPN